MVAGLVGACDEAGAVPNGAFPPAAMSAAAASIMLLVGAGVGAGTAGDAFVVGAGV